MDYASRINELQGQLLALRIADWSEKVFSFQWFFIIFLLIVPWIVWWRLVDRKYIAEILSFGLLITAAATLINGILIQGLFWRDNYTLLPVPPRMFAPTYAYLPVTFMLMYQYFRTWKSFTMATVIVGAISAFVFQPILSLLDMLVLIRWNYVYSFLAFIASGLSLRLLHQAILQTKTTLENVKTISEIKNQPGFASPALKRFLNRLKK